MAPSPQPVVIKAYGNQRLCRPDAGAYVTLDDLAAMVEDDGEFAVIQADSGTEITSSIRQHIKHALHG
jgi:polyhydroxyalkanoate synthesis regulator protein